MKRLENLVTKINIWFSNLDLIISPFSFSVQFISISSLFIIEFSTRTSNNF